MRAGLGSTSSRPGGRPTRCLGTDQLEAGVSWGGSIAQDVRSGSHHTGAQVLQRGRCSPLGTGLSVRGRTSSPCLGVSSSAGGHHADHVARHSQTCCGVSSWLGHRVSGGGSSKEASGEAGLLEAGGLLGVGQSEARSGRWDSRQPGVHVMRRGRRSPLRSGLSGRGGASSRCHGVSSGAGGHHADHVVRHSQTCCGVSSWLGHRVSGGGSCGQTRGKTRLLGARSSSRGRRVRGRVLQ